MLKIKKMAKKRIRYIIVFIIPTIISLMLFLKCSNADNGQNTAPNKIDDNYFKIKERYIELIAAYININKIDSNAVICFLIKKVNEKNTIRIYASENAWTIKGGVDIITRYKKNYVFIFNDDPVFEKIDFTKLQFAKKIYPYNKSIIYDSPCWVYEEENNKIMKLGKN
jgi:hypothetical protein